MEANELITPSNGVELIKRINPNLLSVVDQPMPDLHNNERQDLKNSIVIKGIKEPIRVNHKYEVISGRNRLSIALELGMSEVPCIVSNTEEDPTEKILAYDLELFRRTLPVDKRISLKAERDKLLQQFTDEAVKKIKKRIIPELHDTIDILMFEERDLGFLYKLSRKPKSLQKAFIKEVISDDKFKGDVKTELENLNNKAAKLCIELKDEKKRVKDLGKKYKETESMLVQLQGGFQNEIDNRMKVKVVELEKLYREKAPDEIKKLIDKERSKIRDEVHYEMEELQDNLRDMSQALKDKDKNVSNTEEQLKEVSRQKKDIEASLKSTSKKLDNAKMVIRGLAGSDKIGKRLELCGNDINNVFMSIVEVGVESFQEKDSKWVLKSLIKMHDMIMDIDDVLNLNLQERIKESQNGK